MASEWRTTTLGQVMTLQRGFDLPQSERQPGPYPVVASTGPVGHHLKPMVAGPGVVIGRSGSLGGGQYIRDDFWPLNTTLWVKDFHDNDPRFCYYLLKTLDLAQFNAGSGVPTLNRNHIHPLRVDVPRPPEQRRIAHILGTLEDKIELNRQMNETLEAIARALFKSWFVDFDPVRAKAEGRDPGLPAHLADLFPDSFEDSELGEIPTGWDARPLAEVLAPRNERVGNSDVPEYSSTNDGLKPRAEHFEKQLSRSMAKNKRVIRGDLVFGLSRRVLNFGLMRDPEGGVSPIYKVFSVDNDAVAPDLLERLMRVRPEYYFNAISSSSREGQSISTDALGRLRFVQPLAAAQSAYYRVTRPLFEKATRSRTETRTLAALRDVLLPKLISGELRLNDAEWVVAGVSA